MNHDPMAIFWFLVAIPFIFGIFIALPWQILKLTWKFIRTMKNSIKDFPNKIDNLAVSAKNFPNKIENIAVSAAVSAACTADRLQEKYRLKKEEVKNGRTNI